VADGLATKSNGICKITSTKEVGLSVSRIALKKLSVLFSDEIFGDVGRVTSKKQLEFGDIWITMQIQEF